MWPLATLITKLPYSQLPMATTLIFLLEDLRDVRSISLVAITGWSCLVSLLLTLTLTLTLTLNHNHSHDQSVRVLSRHYIDEAIERAILDQKLLETFTPDLIIAVDETSISPASLLEHHIATKVGKKTPVLTPNWAVYEPDENPYKPVGRVWDQSDQSLAGFKILLVEKVDATRHTLTSFVESLTGKIAEQKAKGGSEWTEPKIGVFALHNKENVASKSELPTGVSHFFAAESSSEGDVKISYPSG